MCGRFTLTVHHIAEAAEALEAVVDEAVSDAYRPRYNVAPGDRHWILRHKQGQRQIVPADWGLINHWAKDPSVAFKQINARAETLAERAAYRDAFARRRCIVLSDGFYEWRGPRGSREPLWIHPEGGGLLLLAGLYESWTDPSTGEVRRTFTVITTPPNALVAPIHDRMPAVLDREVIDDWLLGSHAGAAVDPQRLLHPATVALRADPASPRVNSAENDDPDCLDPDDPKVVKQLTLF